MESARKSLTPHWIVGWVLTLLGAVIIAVELVIVLPRAYEADRTNGVSYTTPTEAVFQLIGAVLFVGGGIYLIATLMRWSRRP